MSTKKIQTQCNKKNNNNNEYNEYIENMCGACFYRKYKEEVEEGEDSHSHSCCYCGHPLQKSIFPCSHRKMWDWEKGAWMPISLLPEDSQLLRKHEGDQLKKYQERNTNANTNSVGKGKGKSKSKGENEDESESDDGD